LTAASEPVALLDDLMAGASLGEALAAINRRDDAQRTGHQLCLFGDPDMRIAPRRADAVPVRAAAPRRPPRRMQLVSADPALRFLELCLHEAPSRQDLPQASQREARLRRHARLALERYRQAPDPAEKTRLRRACVAFAAARGALRDLWMPYAATIVATGKERCPHCGGRALRFEADLAHLDIAPRVLLNCSRCEIVADRPAAWPISAAIRHDGIELQGGSATHIDAIVVSASRWPVAPRTRCWPLAPRGRAASTTLSLADWRWPYPSELSIMLGEGVEIAVLARTLRARPGDAPPP
jgi:hypothetical protein